MRLQNIKLTNYKIFTEQEFVLNGKSTIIFGVNGTGKSTVLSAINYLNRTWINRLNPSQGKAFVSFSDEMISIGKSELYIQGELEVEGTNYPLIRFYEKTKKIKEKVLYHIWH
jgi:predicted ATP-binding protein involved in virulence